MNRIPMNASRTLVFVALISLACPGLAQVQLAAPGEVAPTKPAAVAQPLERRELTDADNGKTVTVKVGTQIALRLAGDRAKTGWEWGGFTPLGAAADASPALVFDKMDFEGREGANDPAIGTYIYTVNAVRAGRCQVLLRYVYPGGQGQQTMARAGVELVRQFAVTIKVE